jgi:hypothetical protein
VTPSPPGLEPQLYVPGACSARHGRRPRPGRLVLRTPAMSSYPSFRRQHRQPPRSRRRRHHEAGEPLWAPGPGYSSHRQEPHRSRPRQRRAQLVPTHASRNCVGQYRCATRPRHAAPPQMSFQRIAARHDTPEGLGFWPVSRAARHVSGAGMSPSRSPQPSSTLRHGSQAIRRAG